MLEPPHLCYFSKFSKDEVPICQVYTENSRNISIDVSLLPALNQNGNDDDWCRYPLGTV